tara:strand:+ start:9129 stop:9590 length:462 start_codon:yes stop_codon:yes gene_type:complete
MSLGYNTWVEVYYNLHKKTFSVRHAGRVWFHTNLLTLHNCKFAVQPAGRARVLKEKKKNVHAFIRGFVLGNKYDLAADSTHTNHRMLHAQQAMYNPYYFSTFVDVDTGDAVYEADVVYLNNCWPKPEIYYESSKSSNKNKASINKPSSKSNAA